MPILHLNVFWCDDADFRQTRVIVTYCRQLAASAGFDLQILPHQDRDSAFVLPYTGEVVSGLERAQNAPEDLDALVDARVGQIACGKTPASRLVVIFGTLGGLPIVGGGYQQLNGYTVRQGVGARPGKLPKYCVVDPAQGATAVPWSCLHEIGHCAGADHSDGDRHDLMIEGNKLEPITISQSVIDAFKTAFFTSRT